MDTITAILTGQVKAAEVVEAGFHKTAATDWQEILNKVMNNQVAQYGLAGAGIGGLGSLMRNIVGNPDPDIEGSAVSRLLRALAMGGLAGAGVAGGAKAMGYDLPSLQSLVQKSKESKAPRWSQSAGVGILGAGGALGLAGMMKGRARNRALLGRLQGLKQHVPAGHSKLFAPAFSKSGPKGTDTRMQQAADYMTGGNRRTRALQSGIDELTDQAATGKDISGLSKFMEEFAKARKPVKGTTLPGTWGQHALAGGLTTGALHQLLGRE